VLRYDGEPVYGVWLLTDYADALVPVIARPAK
jgi:hypothetical protein